MTSACFSRGHTGFSRNATLVATVNPPALAGGVFNLTTQKRIDNRSQRRIISSTRSGCLNGLYPAETAPQLCIHGVSCLLQQPLPHLSISADGTPACGARPDIREGREAYPVSSVPVPCPGGGTSPPCGRATCPGPTWLGTSMLVTRPHAVTETKVASGSSLLGRIRIGWMRRVPKAQNLSLSSGG